MKKNQGMKFPQFKINYKRLRFMVAIFALFLIPGIAYPNLSLAVTQGDLNQVDQKLDQTRDALGDTTAKRRTLQGEVANFDRQISNIQYQINKSQAEINRLNSEVTLTERQIKKAEADLVVAREKLGEVMKSLYEEGQISDMELIARSTSFSEYLNRSEYMESIQIKIKDSADGVIKLKNELQVKKATLETNRKKQEELKKQQLAQRGEVSSQKSIKDDLLAQTKGDEAAYQALVKKLKAEYDRIQRSLWSGTGTGNQVSYGSVQAGDTIGYIGNSGYSTGPHLHFEIRTSNCYSCHVNPSSYIGKGYFQHPTPGVWVSQYYGPANWGAYSFHTGIDYADGGRGTPVLAAADGEIVQRVTGRPNTYSWSVEYGNFVKVRHTNGMYTLYAHLR